MSFVPLKPKSDVLKVSDLLGKTLVGKYVNKEQGQYSLIYWLEDEAEKVTKLFGNKSLDPYMNDSLLGEKLAITCSELKNVGKAYPMAIAQVAIWREEADDTPGPGPFSPPLVQGLPSPFFPENPNQVDAEEYPQVQTQEIDPNQPEPDFSECETPEYDR